MGQMLDLVPNHMGVLGADNAWWLDVLENGPASRYADFFDIDWRPHDRDLAGQVLLPVLAITTARCSSAARSSCASSRNAAASRPAYHEHRFPLRPADVSDASSTSVVRRRRGAPSRSSGARAVDRCAAFACPARDVATEHGSTSAGGRASVATVSWHRSPQAIRSS